MLNNLTPEDKDALFLCIAVSFLVGFINFSLILWVL